MRSANFTPAAEALREPTMAIEGPRQRIEFAAHSDDWRRIRDHLQSRRIFGIAEGEEFNLAARAAFKFSFGLFAGVKFEVIAQSRHGAQDRAGLRAPAGHRRNS